jgi:hypothetical protein
MNNINPGRRRRNGSNFSHLHPFSEYAILPSINRLLDRAILLDTRMQAASLPSSAWQSPSTVRRRIRSARATAASLIPGGQKQRLKDLRCPDFPDEQ